MVNSRRDLGISIAVIAGLSLGILAYCRSAPKPIERSTPVDRLIESAQSSYSSLPMTRWADEGTSLDLAALVTRFNFTIDAELESWFASKKTSLQESLAGFLDTAIVRRDLARYKDWRRSRGDRIRTLEDMNREWFISMDWETDFGEPLPPDLTAEVAFDEHWKRWDEVAGRDSTPIGIVASAEGLECAVGRTDSLGGTARPVLQGSLGRAGWTGGRGGTARTWWTSRRTGTELVRDHKTVVCAEVGVVLEYRNGARHPLVTTWVYDPRDEQWILLYVCVYNWDDQTPVRSMEY